MVSGPRFSVASSAKRYGSTTFGERRASTRRRVERSHGPHCDLEESGARPLSGRTVEYRRRRSRRLGRTRWRAARRLRLSDRIVSALGGPAEEADFVLGQFGENLTVEALPDDEVCIGDRYQIGSAVFEVTQPRVTCYRVGI